MRSPTPTPSPPFRLSPETLCALHRAYACKMRARGPKPATAQSTLASPRLAVARLRRELSQSHESRPSSARALAARVASRRVCGVWLLDRSHTHRPLTGRATARARRGGAGPRAAPSPRWAAAARVPRDGFTRRSLGLPSTAGLAVLALVLGLPQREGHVPVLDHVLDLALHREHKERDEVEQQDLRLGLGLGLG